MKTHLLLILLCFSSLLSTVCNDAYGKDEAVSRNSVEAKFVVDDKDGKPQAMTKDGRGNLYVGTIGDLINNVFIGHDQHGNEIYGAIKFVNGPKDKSGKDTAEAKFVLPDKDGKPQILVSDGRGNLYVGKVGDPDIPNVFKGYDKDGKEISGPIKFLPEK